MITLFEIKVLIQRLAQGRQGIIPPTWSWSERRFIIIILQLMNILKWRNNDRRGGLPFENNIAEWYNNNESTHGDRLQYKLILWRTVWTVFMALAFDASSKYTTSHNESQVRVRHSDQPRDWTERFHWPRRTNLSLDEKRMLLRTRWGDESELQKISSSVGSIDGSVSRALFGVAADKFTRGFSYNSKSPERLRILWGVILIGVLRDYTSIDLNPK